MPDRWLFAPPCPERKMEHPRAAYSKKKKKQTKSKNQRKSYSTGVSTISDLEAAKPTLLPTHRLSSKFRKKEMMEEYGRIQVWDILTGASEGAPANSTTAKVALSTEQPRRSLIVRDSPSEIKIHPKWD